MAEYLNLDGLQTLWTKLKNTFVPTTRTINGKDLSGNVSLTGMDIPIVPGEAEATVYEYLQGTESTFHKVSSWSSTTTDDNYPSEKLVKTELDKKQASLNTQTAYSSKGSATKVPQITTNTLGQVTSITEVTITQPDISGKLDKNGNQTFNGMLSIKSQDASTNSQIRVMDPVGGTARLNFQFNTSNKRGVYDSQLADYVFYIEGASGKPVFNGKSSSASSADKSSDSTKWSGVSLVNTGGYTSLEIV